MSFLFFIARWALELGQDQVRAAAVAAREGEGSTASLPPTTNRARMTSLAEAPATAAPFGSFTFGVRMNLGLFDPFLSLLGRRVM